MDLEVRLRESSPFGSGLFLGSTGRRGVGILGNVGLVLLSGCGMLSRVWKNVNNKASFNMSNGRRMKFYKD